MSISFELKISKNGQNIREVIKQIDHSKPKVWIEGHEYRFNSDIVGVVDIDIQNQMLQAFEPGTKFEDFQIDGEIVVSWNAKVQN